MTTNQAISALHALPNYHAAVKMGIHADALIGETFVQIECHKSRRVARIVCQARRGSALDSVGDAHAVAVALGRPVHWTTERRDRALLIQPDGVVSVVALPTLDQMLDVAQQTTSKTK